MSGNGAELLSRLHGMGIKLFAEGDQLRFNAPTGTMTAELRSEIRQHRPEILRLLHAASQNRQASMESINPVSRRGALPLSHAEQRLWFLHHALPDPSIYNVPTATRLRGTLDIGRLRNALWSVMQRHEILRTGFVEREGTATRVIETDLTVPLVVQELRRDGGRSIEAGIEHFLAEEAAGAFALAVPPLFRATCLRLGPEDHVFVLIAHHIICDEWSLQILRNEVKALYAASDNVTVEFLPELPVQYADYAAWQCQQVARGCMDRDRAYWRHQLQDAPATLDLPVDRGHPDRPSHRGAQCEFFLERSVADAIEQYGTAHHATPFMVWLAAFSAFLARISGQPDLVIGTPLAARTLPEVQSLIGFFLNTLPIRVRIDRATSFGTLLEQVRTVVLDAFEHGRLPLDEIVAGSSASTCPASAGSSPFPVMFVLNEDTRPDWELPGTTAETLHPSTKTAKADLTLFLRRLGDQRMRGSFEYRTDLFMAESIDRVARQWTHLIDSLIRSPHAAISELDLLPPRQWHQLVADFNPLPMPYPRDATVPALFEQCADATPSAAALVLGSQTVTYAELNERANQLAHHLRALGVHHGDRVALLLDRSIDLVVSVLATLKAGAVYVPLDPHFPAERLRFMLDDTAARLLITHGTLSSDIGAEGITTLDLAQERTVVTRSLGCDSEDRITASDPAYIMYTSGSTGRPKGVVIPHRGIVRLVRGQSYVPFSSPQRFMFLASPAFDASTFELWGALLNGATCVIFPDRLPEFEKLEREIRAHRVTCLWLTAGLFNQIIDQRPGILATVQHLITGGEALSTSHVQRALEKLPQLRLVNGYGPTESTTFACTFEIQREAVHAFESVPIGRPINHTRCYILDASQNAVPIAVAGELYIGGDGLACGYLNNPEIESARFVPDPFGERPGAFLYRTGDRCRWLASGHIEFLGRFDDQVKIRGFRIEPGEIKTVLESHPAVGAAVVVVREDSPGDRRLVAYFESRDGIRAALSEIRQHLAARLPDYMVPAVLVPIERIPLTANGKVDRKALPAPDRNCHAVSESRAPQHTIEIELVSIWKRMLKLEHVGVADNFFEIGGHSLLALRLVFEIERRFGRKLSLQSFLAAPTIERISQRLISSTQSGEEPPALRGHGSGAPLFHVPGIDGVGLLPSALVRLIDGERPYFDALQYPGMDGGEAPLDRIEDLAAALLGQIRRVRPHGPYCLTGFCFGGLVAYEVARRLQMAGEVVETLILWDAQPAQCFRRRPLHRAIAMLWRGVVESDGRVWLRALARWMRVSVQAAVKNVITWIISCARWLLPRRDSGATLTPDEISRRVKAAGYRALTAYRPGPYQGRVDLFQTEPVPDKRIWFEPIPLGGWQGIVSGPIQTHPVHCGHHDMLQEPVVSEVAQQTLACLRGAEREPEVSETVAIPEWKLARPRRVGSRAVDVIRLSLDKRSLRKAPSDRLVGGRSRPQYRPER